MHFCRKNRLIWLACVFISSKGDVKSLESHALNLDDTRIWLFGSGLPPYQLTKFNTQRNRNHLQTK